MAGTPRPPQNRAGMVGGIRVLHDVIYTQAGEEGADPGDRRFALAAMGAAAVLIAVVVLFQQTTINLMSQTRKRPPPELARLETVASPGISPLAIESKLAVKMRYVERMAAKHSGQPEELEEADLSGLDAMAPTRTDRLRVAAVAGELQGKAGAISRLKAVVDEAEKGGDLATDAAWMIKVYTTGPDSLPEEARDSLVKRHEWFGRLALAFGKHDSDGARWRVISGGRQIEGWVVGFWTVEGLLTLAGIVIVIVGAVMAANGKITARLKLPAPGGSVYMEMFAVFLAALMLSLSATLITFGAGVEASTGTLVFEQFLLWGCAAAVIWPRVRAVPWKQALADLGLTRGEGVLKEVGCGLLGYMAAQPLVIAVSLAERMFAEGGADKAGPSGFPMFRPPEGNDTVLLVLMVLSTVVWAPLVEETMFRGALQRHLGSIFSFSGSGWLGAAVVTSCAFGLVHPYTAAGLIHVGVLGISLAMLRQWRGSLIAPMVAHAMNNGMIALMTVGITSMLSD